MASYDYSPLAPVYNSKTADEAQIELQDVSSPAPSATPDPCECKTKCEKYWKNRRCCGTADEPRRKRIARCLAVSVAVFVTFWLLAGAGTVAFFGIKLHRCVHPNHAEVVNYQFSPSQIKTIELGLVSGRVTIRSCSKATNVSLTVSNFAPSLELLRVMNVATIVDEKNGLHRTSISSPSFDFSHCQHSTIEVVVPHGAKLDIKAHALLGYIDIEADNESLNNVVVTGRVAGVKVHDSKIAGSLSVDTELGHINLKEITVAAGIITHIRVGGMSVKSVEAASLDSQINIGQACIGNVKTGRFSLLSEFGYVNAWNLDATNVTAHVEYGKLSVVTVPEFKGHFAAVSPFGYLHVDQGKETEQPVFEKNDEATVEGTIGLPATSGVVVAEKSNEFRDFTLTSVYGAVNFFVPNPHTSYWHSQNDEHRKD